MRHELGQLDCRIIVKISGEIERDVELPGVNHLLPFPDIASVLSRGDPDLAPALGQQVGAGVMRHRDIADHHGRLQVVNASLGQKPFRFFP